MSEFIEGIILILVLFVFSVLFFKKKSLDFEGIISANIVGLLVFLAPNSGLKNFFVILLFFVFGEFFTRWSRKKNFEKHESRSIGNIFGNSLAGIIFLWLGFSFAFFGAISAALADTLSSEIGLLSKKKPVLITTFEEVEAGVDGGITFLGLLASFFGAIIIALAYFLFYQNLFGAIAIVFAGVFGSLADSFFGAVLQSKKLVSNNMVNLLGSLSGALVAWVFSVIAKLF